MLASPVVESILSRRFDLRFCPTSGIKEIKLLAFVVNLVVLFRWFHCASSSEDRSGCSYLTTAKEVAG
jgi:hypothetical protein